MVKGRAQNQLIFAHSFYCELTKGLMEIEEPAVVRGISTPDYFSGERYSTGQVKQGEPAGEISMQWEPVGDILKQGEPVGEISTAHSSTAHSSKQKSVKGFVIMEDANYNEKSANGVQQEDADTEEVAAGNILLAEGL